MADNTELNSGTGGDTIATDDIGGIKFQRVKLVHGVDGTNDGDVATANPLPVDIREIGGASVATGGGVEASAIRVTLASDSTGTLTVDNAGTFAVQSTLQANSGVDIGDVDVTSVVPGTGASNLGKAEDAAHVSGDVGVMALAVRSDSLAAIAGTSGDYAPLQVDSSGALYTTEKLDPGRVDVFQRSVVVSQKNDIDIQFFRGDPSDLLIVTTANNATAAQSVGGALFSSSTDANGSVQGVTRSHTVYNSGSEVYCMFTAAFPTPGIASSYMRLGLYDANNGFFFGYEGTSFGVTYRNATADTTVAKGAWSEDNLTGAAGSRFTRAGVPEAIDLTKLNVFRIRFGWLGSAPAYWEVMAPDGHWVTFHKTLFPNLQANPSIRDADLPMTLDITKTAAAATDISIQTDCWGAGTTSSGQHPDDVYAFQTRTTLANGATYDSGVLSLSPHWSQVQTTVNASHNGDITILWYSDAAGTDLVRTLAIVYAASDGFQMYSAPAFTPYVRYQFNNDSGSSQTDFYFDTKFLTKPLSPQILRLDGPLVGGMVASLTRSVIVAKGPGGSYSNIQASAQGNLKIDVEDVGGSAVSTNTGNAGNGTIRVVLANDQPTVNVSASSLPLPSGAATSANQLPDGHNVTVDNASGASAVNIQDGGNSITVDNAGTFAVQATLQASTNTQEVVGDVAHDSPVGGNPLLLAGEARTTTPTAVANGDVVRLQADDQGRLVTSPLAPRDLVTHNQITLSSATETTLISAAASTFHDLVTLAASNTSSTAVRIDIRDSTGGTVRWSMFLAADGGGFVQNFVVPLTQAAVNNNWTAQLSGAVTDVRVMAVAVDRV